MNEITHKVERIERVVREAACDHICDLCGNGIKQGQRYVRIASKVDGIFGVEKHHLPTEPGEEDPCKIKKSSRHWALRPRGEQNDGNEGEGKEDGNQAGRT